MLSKILKLSVIILLMMVSFIYKTNANPMPNFGMYSGNSVQPTGIGFNLFNTFGYGFGGYGTIPGLPPGAYAASHDLIQAIEHTAYPAKCPSYEGWYSPYGHIGFPCPDCHINY